MKKVLEYENESGRTRETQIRIMSGHLTLKRVVPTDIFAWNIERKLNILIIHSMRFALSR